MKTSDHCYNVTECPKCGHDLTSEEGVLVEIVRGGFANGFVQSRLDANGWLEDVHDVLADGLHSDTLCYACDTRLNEYENFDAEDECS